MKDQEKAEEGKEMGTVVGGGLKESNGEVLRRETGR